jgi:hypothetical protein
MTEVEKAETVLAELRARRESLVAHGHSLAQRRTEISFAAHTGDRAARKKLDDLHHESARFESELKSMDDAIAEADRRAQQERAAEARNQDKVSAQALREVVADIGARMRKADKYLAAAVDELNAANVTLDEVHALGSAFPTKQQLATNAVLALKTSLRQLPENWHRDFVEAIPPNLRRSFTQFWARMEEPIRASIAQRLGEKQKDEVAA